jgi:2,3-bisphosphoglycerate-independent phosphoglycerate mutase
MAVVLIILDGIADRPWPALGGRTPLQAARTPNLDRFAAEGATGLLHPLGRGFAPGSELSHFVLFGYPRDRFPGRGVIEALGEDLPLSPDEVVFRGLFSTVERQADGALMVLKRRTEISDEECRELSASIGPFQHSGVSVEFVYNSQHQGIVYVRGAASEQVTDSDPYVAGRTVTLVQPLAAAEERVAAPATATALNMWLARTYRILDAHPINEKRRAEGLDPANFLLVKWSARLRPVPSFAELTGLAGASVSSGVTYKGLAKTVGMDWYGVDYHADWTEDLRMRLATAGHAIAEGHDFVHVHTKAPDEAGHTKDPAKKRDVIERLDAALGDLFAPGGLLAARETDGGPSHLVIVTGDHGTPSGTDLVHSGDAVPIAMIGPATQRDAVTSFDELACASGSLGHMEGLDLMPDVLNRIGRIKYMTAKLTPANGIWWPEKTEPLRVADPAASPAPTTGGVSLETVQRAQAQAQQKSSGWMQRRR